VARIIKATRNVTATRRLEAMLVADTTKTAAKMVELITTS
jgi:hypothetical protein